MYHYEITDNIVVIYYDSTISREFSKCDLLNLIDEIETTKYKYANADFYDKLITFYREICNEINPIDNKKGAQKK